MSPVARVPHADVATEVDSRRGGFPPDSELSVDERCVAVAANDAGVIVAWDVLTSDAFEQTFAVTRAADHVARRTKRRRLRGGERRRVVFPVAARAALCETQAHARFLSAAAMHPRRDVLATVAEDGTIAVWGLPTEVTGAADAEAAPSAIARHNPSLMFAARWPDGMLTGVAFCGDGDDALAVCAYDETEIVAWQ